MSESERIAGPMDSYVCQVGQSAPCGQPAVWAFAIQAVTDSVYQPHRPDSGGVVYICREHSRVPVVLWDRAKVEP